MDTSFINVFVRFYIKQIKDSKPLSEITEETYSELKNKKKFFLFRGKVFSKAEIMGMVVKREIKDNKLIFYVDDSTSVIEATIWKKVNADDYHKAEHIGAFQYVRVLGNYDYYNERKCFEIERIDAVETFERSLLFEKLLFESHQKIFSVKLKENLETKMSKINIDKSSNKYNIKQKELANKFLVFFLLYEIESEDNDQGYVTISLENLMTCENFFFMFKDFIQNFSIDDVDIFLKDVLCFLQENNFVKVQSTNKDLYGYLKEAVLTVKTNNPDLENNILCLFRMQEKGKIVTLTYFELTDYKKHKYMNIHTTEYIKKFLKYLCERKLLVEISHNTFALYEYFN